MESFRVALCTAPEREALRLAHAVVEEGLAACVNIVPSVTSVYRWGGEICEDREALLIMKTTALALEALTALVKQLHSYTVPEVICLPIDGERGNPDYLEWLAASVMGPAPEGGGPTEGPETDGEGT